MAMTTAVALLVITSLPFFAVAFTDGIGDFDDFNPGDFDDFGIGDFDDFGAGDFDDFAPGGFDDFTPGDIGTPDDDYGFDEFDDDDGPFGGTPGNPGDDFIPDPDPNGDCIVDCNPLPNPNPNPRPRPGSSDTLRIFIHRIFLNDPFEQLPGTVLPLRITFENDGSKDMDNTKVLVMIPDLQLRDTVGPFNLDTGDQVTKMLFLELPEGAAPGTYPVRLFIHNLQDKRIVHREIEVVDYS